MIPEARQAIVEEILKQIEAAMSTCCAITDQDEFADRVFVLLQQARDLAYDEAEKTL